MWEDGRTMYVDALVNTFRDDIDNITKQNHLEAIVNPRPGHEAAFVYMIRGCLEYADGHQVECGFSAGEDAYLGKFWGDIAFQIEELLSGPLGRLDPGSLSLLINKVLCENGIDPDEYWQSRSES